MKHVIIGTAGHVDHGKTTLIQALTGTNPDRLKEEQERGMTIDIGFAQLTLPDGTVAGIVDVPGHERFLKNMLAGASGVDVVLLVIAADESVMPQTKEHLDILRLLDVRNGVVALTRCDLVEKEWTDAVEEDVRAHLKDTFLAKVPLIRVSSVTRKGIEALKRELMSAVSRVETRNANLPFRLPIDRVFTRPGFGTVVTGTLVSGTLRTGDPIEISPKGITSRVRGLQVHGKKVPEATAGSRVAVNIAGIETEAIERGTQLAPPGYIVPTVLFDAVLRLLPHAPAPLKDRDRVRLHLGTAELLGRIRLLDERTELEPGGKCYVQFRGEEPFAGVRGDRFVVRTYSPMTTIGGGIILDTAPPRHRKADLSALSTLEAKERGTPEDVIETSLLRSPSGILQKELAGIVGLPPTEVDTPLSTLIEAGKVLLLPGERLFLTSTLATHTARATATLQAYHSQYPLRAGMPKEEFRVALGKTLDTRAFASLLNYWQHQKQIDSEGNSIRLSNFEVTLNERQQNLLARIEEVYKAAQIATPTIEEVSRDVQAPPDAISALLKVGQERGLFFRVADGIYYHAATLKALEDLITDYVKQHGSITVGAFRDMTDSNRKFSLQALEYFDAVKFTRRVGDERTLFHS